MGKRYDWQVTPQNTPRFKDRRILFLTAMGLFIINFLLTGIFLSANLLWYTLGAVLVAFFAGAQYFDNRREMWTWVYVIFWIIFSFAASAALFLWHRAYWWFVGYGIELVAFFLLIVSIFKKKSTKARTK